MKIVGDPFAGTQLKNVRAGRHGCYDRLVFDVRAENVMFYRAEYVTAVTDESGRVVPVRGGAKLKIMSYTADHDRTGWAYPYKNRAELVNVSGYRTFRQVAWVDSDIYGYTHFGLGVRARLPFRIFTLPGRLVIDVAHRW